MNMPCEQFLRQALQVREEATLLRQLPSDKRTEIDLTSNDYLGFARSQSLAEEIQSVYQTLMQKGEVSTFLGATGSRLLTGNPVYIELLEKEIAHFHRAESSLIFNSGYSANTGLISAVIGKSDRILLDAEVHASIWDGATLSRAKVSLFRHNDPEHLKRRLIRASASPERLFVIVESLYSMSGDFAPLKEIVALCQNYGAYLIVDEAHATGIFGPRGEGLVAASGLEEQVFARVHTFGKAFGAHGAAVVGSASLTNYLVNFSRSFIYTTALPLHSFVTISCAYKKVKDASQERERLCALIRYFSQRVEALQLPIATTATPIQTVPIRENYFLTALNKKIENAGIDVRSVRYPTVRRGRQCLRVCLHAFNKRKEIDHLLSIFAEEKKEVFA